MSDRHGGRIRFLGARSRICRYENKHRGISINVPHIPILIQVVSRLISSPEAEKHKDCIDLQAGKIRAKAIVSIS